MLPADRQAANKPLTGAKETQMRNARRVRRCLFMLLTALGLTGAPAFAQEKKPNIVFIMGDDIGWMQPSIYHQGLMVGETPNIDRIAREGAKFMTYYAEQSCTAGRTAFFTGMTPLRAGMIPPQLPGSPSFLQPGTPSMAKFLLDLGYTTGEFGKNHLGDHSAALPTAHGFQEFWGYLYHLDAMQGVSFPDINKTPTEQAIVPPCKNTPVRGLSDPPGAVDAKTTLCMMPPRPVIGCTSSDGTEKNQSCKDEGPLTLERSKTVDEEDLGQGDRLPRSQRPEEDQQAVLRLVQPRAGHSAYRESDSHERNQVRNLCRTYCLCSRLNGVCFCTAIGTEDRRSLGKNCDYHHTTTGFSKKCKFRIWRSLSYRSRGHSRHTSLQSSATVT